MTFAIFDAISPKSGKIAVPAATTVVIQYDNPAFTSILVGGNQFIVKGAFADTVARLMEAMRTSP